MHTVQCQGKPMYLIKPSIMFLSVFWIWWVDSVKEEYTFLENLTKISHKHALAHCMQLQYGIWSTKVILTGKQSSSYSSQRHKFVFFFSCMRLCTKQSFIPSCKPAAGEQHWSCQAVSPGTQLEALKGGLCSACSHWASKTPSEEFSHLLIKSEHTAMFKSRGINKQ